MAHGPMTVPARTPKVLLSTAATTGTINSGVTGAEFHGFGAIGFAMVPLTAGTTPTGYSAAVYGTMDPGALNDDGTVNTNYPIPGAAGGAWFELPAASNQNAAPDAQNYANPLTAITQTLFYRGPAVLAVFVVVTATAASNGCQVVGWAWD